MCYWCGWGLFVFDSWCWALVLVVFFLIFVYFLGGWFYCCDVLVMV